MFMVLLRFSDNKSQASQLMDGHNAWIARGFDDGVFCWLEAFSLVWVAELSRIIRRWLILRPE